MGKYVINQPEPLPILNSAKFGKLAIKAEQLKKQLKEIEEQIIDIGPDNCSIYCKVCEKNHSLSQWIWIQGHYHIQADGHGGGDYWLQDDDFVCKCSLCESKYRAYGGKAKEMKRWKRFFGSVDEVYRDADI